MSWEQLLTIVKERPEVNPPVACPNDGTPLQPAPGGVLHCPFDGWQWPRDKVT